jgi:hypothetical protein
MFTDTFTIVAARMLFPPTKTCTTPGCMNTNLLRDKDGLQKVILFTLSDGACATYAGHLHCSRKSQLDSPTCVLTSARL